MNTRFKENVQKLFEYWCEISPTAIGEKVSGVIVESFPDKFKDPEIIKKIPEFAYPCQFLNESVQTYSFVLTSTDSKWRFGFCRHDAKTQTAMVLITYLPWHDTFLKFLNVLGELKRTSKDEFQPFLAEAYSKGVPGPGACLKLFYNAGLNNFIFRRPEQLQLPSIPENHNLNLYYNFVDPKNMIAVFAAMLAERRIIFTSQRLDRVSSCVQAANAFLYPMVWQHIFIPILPLKMKEILCAPMPYLIGVPEAVLETMTREELGEVVILNCDNKYIETPFDDVKKMPTELVSQLKKQLNNQNDHMGDRVSKIFLGVLVQLIGGYRDANRYRHGEKITWCPDTFIETRPSHLRPFLRDMLQLQIFQQFIEERLEMLNTGLGVSDEFELETQRYHEKSTKRGKTWKIVTTVKDKTNPAVKSAVQSVKQGGRGMKTVYKDIKSKMSDRTPPKHSNRSSSMASTATTAAIGCHHSAPNSPVFSKRPQNDFISISNCSTHRSKPQKMLQTSNSMINNSNLTNHFNNNITINNNSNPNQINCMQHDAIQATTITTTTTISAITTARTTSSAMPIHGKYNNSQTISKSPITIGSSSPTSSISSTSEMNILQELQQHALFKISTVDRHELDINDSSASNSLSSFETPLEQLPPVPPRITNPPPRNRRVSESLIIIDSDEKQQQQQQRQQQQSHQHKQQSLNDNNNLRISAPLPIVARSKPKPIISPSMQTASTPQSFANIRMAFENNFVQNSKKNSNSNSNSFNSIKQSNGIKPSVHRSQPFIEPPPLSTKQSNQLNNDHKMSEDKLDSSTDLIELDASTSFEIDDFDPLNQNAKQLPIVRSKGAAPSIVLPQMSSIASAPPNAYAAAASGVQAFSNPVYPFHIPGQLPPKPQSSTSSNSLTNTTATTSKIDDELELLRKYGLDLDRFKIVDTNRSIQCNGTANDMKFNRISNNNLHPANDSMFQSSQRTWTTFD